MADATKKWTWSNVETKELMLYFSSIHVVHVPAFTEDLQCFKNQVHPLISFPSLISTNANCKISTLRNLIKELSAKPEKVLGSFLFTLNYLIKKANKKSTSKMDLLSVESSLSSPFLVFFNSIKKYWSSFATDRQAAFNQSVQILAQFAATAVQLSHHRRNYFSDGESEQLDMAALIADLKEQLKARVPCSASLKVCILC